MGGTTGDSLHSWEEPQVIHFIRGRNQRLFTSFVGGTTGYSLHSWEEPQIIHFIRGGNHRLFTSFVRDQCFTKTSRFYPWTNHRLSTHFSVVHWRITSNGALHPPTDKIHWYITLITFIVEHSFHFVNGCPKIQFICSFLLIFFETLPKRFYWFCETAIATFPVLPIELSAPRGLFLPTCLGACNLAFLATSQQLRLKVLFTLSDTHFLGGLERFHASLWQRHSM